MKIILSKQESVALRNIVTKAKNDDLTKKYNAIFSNSLKHIKSEVVNDKIVLTISENKYDDIMNVIHKNTDMLVKAFTSMKMSYGDLISFATPAKKFIEEIKKAALK